MFFTPDPLVEKVARRSLLSRSGNRQVKCPTLSLLAWVLVFYPACKSDDTPAPLRDAAPIADFVRGDALGPGGASGTGGVVTTGGVHGTGGAAGFDAPSAAGDTSSPIGLGGSQSTGGVVASGGKTGVGGAAGHAGTLSDGGTTAVGGGLGTGGTIGTGGTPSSGGAGTGGIVGGGGAGAGGAVGTGGTTGEGGVPGSGGVGAGGTAGSSTSPTPDAGPVYGNPLAGNPTPRKVEGREGFDSEGPLWVGTYLLFSDVNNAKIWKLDPSQPPAQRFTQFAYGTGTKTNGLALDGQGNLLVCERETGTIGRVSLAGGTPVVVASGFGGKRFNAPNDIVVRADGNIYFTDPAWGSGTGTPLPLSAYRIATNGDVSLVTTGSDRPTSPNGIALSPSGNTLFVGDDTGGAIWKYDVAADGSTSGGTRFITGIATPDGIAIDDAGNLYVASNTAANAIKVYQPNGALIGDIGYPARPSNASFGGPDRKTLYATVATAIYTVDLAVPGLP